ncbi:transcription factor HES-4-A-like [Mercenaria mercenaria]|uniref:transcription factor HES-4-A-like n=1 Tax=Mercenaria mercenaria TaxID=6596 RepID=UPI00234EDB47|nr:transcription factor HES-4-A-like [Mercenaria mercenaria]
MEVSKEMTSVGTGEKLKRSIRKLKKPLMEKKRRDRINRSLLQLKTLILENIRRNGGTQTAKLDKADILEMTVNCMMTLQYGQSIVTMVNKHQYNYGYQICERDAMRVLGDSKDCSSWYLSRHRRNIFDSQTTDDIFQPDVSADDIISKQQPIGIAIPQLPVLTSTPNPLTIDVNKIVKTKSKISEGNEPLGNLLKLDDRMEPEYEINADDNDVSSDEFEASESRTSDIVNLRHSEAFNPNTSNKANTIERSDCYCVSEVRVWRPW